MKSQGKFRQGKAGGFSLMYSSGDGVQMVEGADAANRQGRDGLHGSRGARSEIPTCVMLLLR